MQDWDKVDNVPVTLHLTAEAARILRQHAGERNRGWFVSQLLMELNRDDNQEGKEIMNQVGEAVRAALADQTAKREAAMKQASDLLAEQVANYKTAMKHASDLLAEQAVNYEAAVKRASDLLAEQAAKHEMAMKQASAALADHVAKQQAAIKQDVGKMIDSHQSHTRSGS